MCLGERFRVEGDDEDRGARQSSSAVVKRLFRGFADELICATDAFIVSEGELIFRYILELTGCSGKPAKRLWLNSLTETAIRDAFARLRPLSDYDALVRRGTLSKARWPIGVVGLNDDPLLRTVPSLRRRLAVSGVSAQSVQTPVLGDDCASRRMRSVDLPFMPFWELLTRYREVTFKVAGDRFCQGARRPAGQSCGRCRVELNRRPAAVDRKPERILPPCSFTT